MNITVELGISGLGREYLLVGTFLDRLYCDIPANFHCKYMEISLNFNIFALFGLACKQCYYASYA